MSLRRVAPLSGIVFVVLTAVAFVALGGSTPGVKDSSAKIAAFYADHSQKQEAAAFVLMIGVGFLALFVASCWPLIRDPHRLWSGLFFAGGIIAAAGFLLQGLSIWRLPTARTTASIRWRSRRSTHSMRTATSRSALEWGSCCSGGQAR